MTSFAARRTSWHGEPLHLLRRAEQLMGMPQAVELWTAEMVRALPDDGQRYECVDGELLVSPAPNFPHQRIVGAVYRRLYEYLRGTTLGEVCFSPADIELDR